MCFDGLSLAVLKENDVEYQIRLPWQTWAFISLRKTCFLQKTLIKNLVSVERGRWWRGGGVYCKLCSLCISFTVKFQILVLMFRIEGWAYKNTGLQLCQQLLVFY